MQGFVSRRSSSSVDLDSTSLDDVRTERAAIALSVGLSWPPVRRRRSRRRPSWQQHWERALQEHIRLQRPVWWRPGQAIDGPLTHKKIAHTSTPCAAPAAPSTSAAALVEDPIVRDWFLDMLDQRKTERGIPRCLGEVQRLCPGLFDEIHHSTPYRWKRSSPRAAPLGRKTSLSPADVTQLSEHIMR